MIPSRDLVRVFLALHRAGSYEAAAQALGMDTSTVRPKIQSLESNLGMTLSLRSARGVVLVPGQEELINAALEMEASANRFEQTSDDARSGDIVRLSMLDLFASLIIEGIKTFRSANPDIILDNRAILCRSGKGRRRHRRPSSTPDTWLRRNAKDRECSLRPVCRHAICQSPEDTWWRSHERHFAGIRLLPPRS